MTKVIHLYLLFISLILSINCIAQEFRFVDYSESPVPCEIKLRYGNKIINTTTTNHEGICNLDSYNCKPNTIIIANSISLYYRRPIEVPYIKEDRIIKIPTVTQYSNLINNSRLFQNDENDMKAIATSALATNELAALSRNIDLSNTDSLEAQVIELTATYLNLPKEPAIYLDPLQGGKVVASEELIEEIKKYQLSNDIKVSGQIDALTLSKMAETTSWTVIEKEF